MNRAILFSLFIALGSCTYSPEQEGEFFKEIQVNENPEVTLLLNSFDDGATIDIYAPTVFSFDYSSSFGSFEELKIYVDNSVIYTSSSPTGSFDYNIGVFLQTGNYSLKLEAISKSNTGSLADKLGAEKFVVTKNWTLNVNTDPPPPPALSLSVENGFLKLSWTAYSKSNFVKYQVVRNGNGWKTIDITNPNQNFYLDGSYLGGYPVEYQVSTYTFWHAASSAPVTYSASFKVTGGMDQDGQVTLTWNKTKFYGPFKNYTIQENGIDRLTITNLNDTTIQFKPFDLIFNYNLDYSVATRNSNNEGPSSSISIDLFSIIPKIPVTPTFWGYNGATDRIIGYAAQDVFLFTNELELSATISSWYGKVVPPSGDYFYTVSQNATHLLQKDILSDEAIDSIKFSDFAPNGTYEFPYVWSASSNQVIAFGFTGPGSVFGSKANYAFVYDMANHLMIFQQMGTTPPHVSPNGKYLFFGGSPCTIREIVNNTTTQLYSIPTQGLIRFSTLNDGEFYTITFFDVIRVYDAATGSLKRVINPPETSYAYSGIDPVSEKILYTKNYSTICYAVDPSTSAAIPIKAYSTSDSPIRLVNNYLINKYGNYIKVIP